MLTNDSVLVDSASVQGQNLPTYHLVGSEAHENQNPEESVTCWGRVFSRCRPNFNERFNRCILRYFPNDDPRAMRQYLGRNVVWSWFVVAGVIGYYFVDESALQVLCMAHTTIGCAGFLTER